MAYGKDFDFDSVLKADNVVKAFRSSQPVMRYDHYAPYIERICEDEPNRMENECLMQHLAHPMAATGFQLLLLMGSIFFSRGILVVFHVLYNKMSSFFQELQRSCKLAFASNYQYTSSGKLKIGANSSGPNDRGFERLLPLYSTPILEAYQIPQDEQAAIYMHALFTLLDRNLGMVEGNFVTLPFRLFGLTQKTALVLAQDIEAGKLSPEIATIATRQKWQ